MKEKITHFGTIQQVENGKVSVSIMQTSACSSCHAASLCQSSEKVDKTVEVFCRNSQEYHVGDHVVIEGTTGQSLQAVLLAYVVPVILIIGILLASVSSLGEASAALLSLVCVGVYFVLLGTQKKRLTRTFTFEITKSAQHLTD